MRSGLLALAMLLLTACAAASPARQRAPVPVTALSPQHIAAGLAGCWDNARQYAQAPDALKVPPSVDGDWLDLQHACFTRVEAPALGGVVLYLEWRRGGPNGPVSRQRIWSFRSEDGGEVRMDFYAFVDGAPWAGRASEPAAFAGLDAAALRGYGPDCALRFATDGGGWRGVVSAEACTLTAASGRRMGIDATVALGADGVLSYRESGRLADGRWAFRVPPGEPYRFERLRERRRVDR